MRGEGDVAVLGAGSWGTSLALLLARNGRRVRLWGHDPDAIAELASTRHNAAYLPGIPLPDAISVTADPGALRGMENFLVAVPSAGFRETLVRLQPHLDTTATVAWATKGLEPGSRKLLSTVAAEVLGDRPTGLVSGPTFAREIAQGLPAAMVAAAREPATAERIAGWLRGERVRVYTNPDVIGVETGGATKNVMAIAAGISDGLGFGANARAALITRGLAEMTRLGVALGGQAETFMGLAGLGDLVLTCTDNQSRNRRVGLGLGQGRSLPEVTRELGQVAEGVGTAREVHELAQQMGVDMPITRQVFRVLFEGLAPEAAVEALLRREAKPE